MWYNTQNMTDYTCIKPACDNKYQSSDTEAYYCPSCVEEKNKIAKKVDAQIASRPSKRPTTSAWQEYEKSTKMNTGGIQGVHIKI